MTKFTRAFGFFSLGLAISLIVGYWLKKEQERTRQAVIPEYGDEDEHVVLSSRTLDTVGSSQPDEVDDLTRINGIGPKTAEALQKAGIISYSQLAAASPKALLSHLEGVRGVNEEKISSWIKQAAEFVS